MINDPASGHKPFWLARSTRTIFFFAAMLTVAGIYFAFQVPISVFPQTNFPRVVIGVDNGVMPVEQMQVTITKPIEDAVNSVPGLQTVRSTTSRGSAEISLFFDWNQDMFHSLQLSLSPLFPPLPPLFPPPGRCGRARDDGHGARGLCGRRRRWPYARGAGGAERGAVGDGGGGGLRRGQDHLHRPNGPRLQGGGRMTH